MSLPRIGQEMAWRIVEERGKGGHFTSWQDFRERVRGIGPKTLKRIQAKAKMGPATKGPNPNYVRPRVTDESKRLFDEQMRPHVNPEQQFLPPGHTVRVSDCGIT